MTVPISNFTAAANTAAIGCTTGYSLTGANAQSMVDLAGTWNTSGNPVALKVAISNTASGTTSKFASFLAGSAGTTEVFSIGKAGDFGLVGTAAFLPGSGGTFGSRFDNYFGGTLRSIFNSGGVILGSGGGYYWSSASSPTDLDLALVRDAANTLAQRNGTNAQALRVYNTYTDASNYERTSLYWTSNQFRIYTEQAGTGAARAIVIVAAQSLNLGAAGGAIRFNIGAGAATEAWNIAATGNIIAMTDNTYDIGASGATRPRNVYVAGTGTFGGSITSSSTIKAGSTSYIQFNARTALSSPSDGVLLLQNDATTDFSRLQFGGTTSSFPAWKRSTTVLQARLADDSAYTSVAASAFQTTTALETAVDGGSTAAFTANMVGSTGGPTTAAQNGWVKMTDSSGATIWVPVWK